MKKSQAQQLLEFLHFLSLGAIITITSTRAFRDIVWAARCGADTSYSRSHLYFSYRGYKSVELGRISRQVCTMDHKETEEQRQMRRVAFFAVVISTAAVIASVVTLPMLYSYVQSFQSHLIVETEYCKVCSLTDSFRLHLS